jgi:hypothetical protein
MIDSDNRNDPIVARETTRDFGIFLLFLLKELVEHGAK